MPEAITVEVDGRTLSLSNMSKVFYPRTGFTKGQVIDYYTRIAPVILPHLRGRPLTLKRYPNGVEAPFFYEKECPRHRPPWVRTAAISSRRNGEVVNYCVVDELPTLVWAANLASLELHTSLALADEIANPTMVVFDLDPGPGADLVLCSRVAIQVREVFDAIGLQSFPKTSGSKGLQVYAPLNSGTPYSVTKPFAQAVAQHLEAEHPDTVTSNMSKAARPGKVFVDWSQNDQHKTTVCVYSLRAREVPSVSVPVDWEEVETCARSEDSRPLNFESAEVLERVARLGDLFEPVLSLVQHLP